MAIGALEALSLSTAIIQFVDFTAKLVSKGYKLHHSVEGALLEFTDLDTSARNVIHLNNAIIDQYEGAKKIDPYRSGGSIPLGSESDLKTVCKGCNEAAEKLVIALERLKGTG